MPPYSVLIVEDENNLAEIVRDYLQVEGIQSTILNDGKYVLDTVKEQTPSVILLDIMLPDKDGITLCKEIRHFSQVPIIMTTARVDEIDRIIGLEIGADDYVCKPYSPRELVARVKVQLRKLSPVAANTESGLLLDEQSMVIKFGTQSDELTFVEFRLLKKLKDSKGRIFNREQLMDSIYDDGRIVSDRTIDSHIKKIRKKLKQLNPEKDYIHAIYGCGYKYE
ncbi:MAG: response regulator [bacterium]